MMPILNGYNVLFLKTVYRNCCREIDIEQLKISHLYNQCIDPHKVFNRCIICRVVVQVRTALTVKCITPVKISCWSYFHAHLCLSWISSRFNVILIFSSISYPWFYLYCNCLNIHRCVYNSDWHIQLCKFSGKNILSLVHFWIKYLCLNFYCVCCNIVVICSTSSTLVTIIT